MGAGGASGIQGKASRSARKHTSKIKSRHNVSGGLMLTSMLDILVCVLFFLLKNYTSVVSDFSAAKDLSLPYSSSIQVPASALHLVVTQKAILLDDVPIVDLVNGDIQRGDLYKDGVVITKLAQALSAQKERSMNLQQLNDEKTFTGAIVLQADKNLAFHLLKKVIYTAGIYDFVNLKLAALKKEEG